MEPVLVGDDPYRAKAERLERRLSSYIEPFSVYHTRCFVQSIGSQPACWMGASQQDREIVTVKASGQSGTLELGTLSRLAPVYLSVDYLKRRSDSDHFLNGLIHIVHISVKKNVCCKTGVWQASTTPKKSHDAPIPLHRTTRSIVSTLSDMVTASF